MFLWQPGAPQNADDSRTRRNSTSSSTDRKRYKNQGADQHLRDYPFNCTNYRFTNSHRHDLQVPRGIRHHVSHDGHGTARAMSTAGQTRWSWMGAEKTASWIPRVIWTLTGWDASTAPSRPRHDDRDLLRIEPPVHRGAVRPHASARRLLTTHTADVLLLLLSSIADPLYSVGA